MPGGIHGYPPGCHTSAFLGGGLRRETVMRHRIIAVCVATFALLGGAAAAAVPAVATGAPAATGGWHSTRLAPDMTYEAVMYHDIKPATTNWG